MLDGVSQRIDALEGHLAQLLARQRQGLPLGPAEASPAPRSPAIRYETPSKAPENGDAGSVGAGRIVRPDLHFENDDADGFDERFNAFTDSTDVDERSRNWLLS